MADFTPRVTLQWAWHHKYLTGLGFMGTGALFGLVHALYGLGFLLFLIGAAPFGLKFLKWSLFFFFLGGSPSDSPDDKPWKKDRYGKRQ
jgi:hypothetical protein